MGKKNIYIFSTNQYNIVTSALQEFIYHVMNTRLGKEMMRDEEKNDTLALHQHIQCYCKQNTQSWIKDIDDKMNEILKSIFKYFLEIDI